MGDNTKSIEKINEQISLLNRVPDDDKIESNYNENDDYLISESDTLKVDKIDDLNSVANIITEHNYSIDDKSNLVDNKIEDKVDEQNENNFIFYIFIIVLLIILCFLLYILFK